MTQFTKEELIVIHNRCLIPTIRFAEMFDENLCADDFTVSIDLWEKLEKMTEFKK